MLRTMKAGLWVIAGCVAFSALWIGSEAEGRITIKRKQETIEPMPVVPMPEMTPGAPEMVVDMPVGPVEYGCCEPVPASCCPPSCPKMVKTTLHFKHPCTCCPLCVDVCIPACCCGEAPKCCYRHALIGVGVFTFTWCDCDHEVKVRLMKSGRMIVRD